MSKATLAQTWATLGCAMDRAGYWVREYFGENHYARYVAEWNRQHTGRPVDDAHQPLSERDFFALRIQVSYGGGAQRC